MIDGHNLNSDEAAAREVIAVVGDEGFFDENINLEKLGKYYGQMYVRFDMEKYHCRMEQSFFCSMSLLQGLTSTSGRIF